VREVVGVVRSNLEAVSVQLVKLERRERKESQRGGHSLDFRWEWSSWQKLTFSPSMACSDGRDENGKRESSRSRAPSRTETNEKETVYKNDGKKKETEKQTPFALLQRSFTSRLLRLRSFRRQRGVRLVEAFRSGKGCP